MFSWPHSATSVPYIYNLEKMVKWEEPLNRERCEERNQRIELFAEENLDPQSLLRAFIQILDLINYFILVELESTE